MKRALVFVAFAALVGCATDVQDPVEQLPEAPAPREPTTQTFGAPLQTAPELNLGFKGYTTSWSKSYVDMYVPPKQQPVQPHIEPQPEN